MREFDLNRISFTPEQEHAITEFEKMKKELLKKMDDATKELGDLERKLVAKNVKSAVEAIKDAFVGGKSIDPHERALLQASVYVREEISTPDDRNASNPALLVERILAFTSEHLHIFVKNK